MMNVTKEFLADKTILFLGGTSGIGLSAARMAKNCSAKVILVGRNEEKLQLASQELQPTKSKQLDVTFMDDLQSFLEEMEPLDHIFATHSGPYYASLEEADFDKVAVNFHDRFISMLAIAKYGSPKIRKGGSIMFMGGTASRKFGKGYSLSGPMNNATETLTKSLAVELAPVRINMIAAGFVNTTLSKSILGMAYEDRLAELRRTLPINSVVEPEDVAMLAIQVMANPGITGSILDIDGGQQLVH